QQERLQREVTRQQALVRAAHRTVGLTAPSAPAGKASGPSNGKKRRRRPVARALSVAARLHTTISNSSDVADNAKEATGDVCQSTQSPGPCGGARARRLRKIAAIFRKLLIREGLPCVDDVLRDRLMSIICVPRR